MPRRSILSAIERTSIYAVPDDMSDLITRFAFTEQDVTIIKSHRGAEIRKVVKSRGHFPTETAALKCVYLAVMSLDPTGRGRQRWMNRWKHALNAFTITFPGRIIPTNK